MKRLYALVSLTVACIWSMLILTQSAHAYLDPGTGSYFLQILMAALLGASFTLKIYWQRIKMMMRGGNGKESKQ